MRAVPESREAEGSKTMVVLKCVLMLVGAGVFGSTGALVVYDIYVSTQLRRLLRGKNAKAGSFFQRGVKHISRKSHLEANLKNEIPFVQAKACAAAHR